VKKLITMSAAIVLQSACHAPAPSTATTTAPRPVATNSGLTGAADPAAAVRTFMAAAKQQDLQALGGVWGDANGPARDAIAREELERRELIMLKCLRHDRYDVVGDAPGAAGARVLAVAITYKEISQSTNFTVVRGPSNRWYVEKFDIEAVQKLCVAP